MEANLILLNAALFYKRHCVSVSNLLPSVCLGFILICRPLDVMLGALRLHCCLMLCNTLLDMCRQRFCFAKGLDCALFRTSASMAIDGNEIPLCQFLFRSGWLVTVLRVIKSGYSLFSGVWLEKGPVNSPLSVFWVGIRSVPFLFTNASF